MTREDQERKPGRAREDQGGPERTREEYQGGPGKTRENQGGVSSDPQLSRDNYIQLGLAMDA